MDDNDPAKMNLALNNLSNVYDFYKKKGEKIRVELVAYGPGMHMFRADTSPVRSRLDQIKLAYDNVVYTACGNTIAGIEKAEGKELRRGRHRRRGRRCAPDRTAGTGLELRKAVSALCSTVMPRRDNCGWRYRFIYLNIRK